MEKGPHPSKEKQGFQRMCWHSSPGRNKHNIIDKRLEAAPRKIE